MDVRLFLLLNQSCYLKKCFGKSFFFFNVYKLLQLFLLTKSALNTCVSPFPMVYWGPDCLTDLLTYLCLHFMGREKASFWLILHIIDLTSLCVIALNRPPCVDKTIRMARPRENNFMHVLEKHFMLLFFLSFLKYENWLQGHTEV